MNNAKIHPNAICIAYGILYDVPLEIISFKWRQNYCRWRATKFGLALKLHYLWARRDRYRATNVVTWGPRFFWGGGGVSSDGPPHFVPLPSADKKGVSGPFFPRVPQENFLGGGGSHLKDRPILVTSPLTTSKGFLGLFLPVFLKKRTVCLFETYYANLQEQLRAAVREKKPR